MHKVAVYREEDGSIHKCSAVCTHLGCVVQWNGSEKSWDCPCHGSRFDTDGHVLNGPALRALKEMPEPEPSHAPHEDRPGAGDAA
jgi:Rieske Fe-S protein